MTDKFELSEDTQDKLTAVREASNLSDNASPEKVVSTLANYYLIRQGDTEELSKIKEQKEATEAKREALRDFIRGDSRGK